MKTILLALGAVVLGVWVLSYWSGDAQHLRALQAEAKKARLQAARPTESVKLSYISGFNWFGCRERAKTEELTRHAGDRDLPAFTNLLSRAFVDDQCTRFKSNEAVLVSVTALSTGFVQARRQDETEFWWTPVEAFRSTAASQQPSGGSKPAKERTEASARLTSIQIRGRTISVGDLEDDAIAFLNDIFKGDRPADRVARAARPDPDIPNSLIKTMKFSIDGHTYSLTTRRTVDPGPYRLTEILRSTHPLPAPPDTPNQPSTQSREAPRTHRMEGNFGCRDRTKFEELNGYHVNQNDIAFLGGLVRAYKDGTCRTFDDGEEVYVTERAISSGLVRVRPKGETSSWWTYAEATR